MASLRHCSEILDQEEQADAQMRAAYGDRWVRPQSNILTSALRETVGRYQANLATAGESDARVLSKLEANRGRLESLSADGARSLVPTLQQPMVVPGAPNQTFFVEKYLGSMLLHAYVSTRIEINQRSFEYMHVWCDILAAVVL